MRKNIQYMGQSMQEWSKQNLWKPAFEKFELIYYVLRDLVPFAGCKPATLLK